MFSLHVHTRFIPSNHAKHVTAVREGVCHSCCNSYSMEHNYMQLNFTKLYCLQSI